MNDMFRITLQVRSYCAKCNQEKLGRVTQLYMNNARKPHRGAYPVHCSTCVMNLISAPASQRCEITKGCDGEMMRVEEVLHWPQFMFIHRSRQIRDASKLKYSPILEMEFDIVTGKYIVTHVSHPNYRQGELKDNKNI